MFHGIWDVRGAERRFCRYPVEVPSLFDYNKGVRWNTGFRRGRRRTASRRMCPGEGPVCFAATCSGTGISMQKVILVGVNLNNDPNFAHSMEELESLAQACDMEVEATAVQNLPAVNAATYIGSGKVEEVRRLAEAVAAECAVFDDTLSPVQQRNLQEEMDVAVLDRTGLILEIFGRRARTKEARLQVESASLQYMLPRLVGMRKALSRQGGGAGAGGGWGAGGGLANRGAGETRLELDRRKIEKRLAELRRELDAVEQDRRTQRKRRRESDLPSVALVGYTNAGKSTLMNALLDAYGGREEKKVLEQDMLFATLDTTVRRISPGDNRDFLLSDTVGFISGLPHTLVKAFRSTLSEAVEADLLIHVVDFSDPNYREQMKVTQDTLRELKADHIPCLTVMNKADRVMDAEALPKVSGGRICLSAKKELGIGELLSLIREALFAGMTACRLKIPYTDGAAVSWLKEHAAVKSMEYEADGVLVLAECRRGDAARLERYLCGEKPEREEDWDSHAYDGV